ncbi:MAG TPA: guanylate kinase [Sneathiellales bacterium]|jgi:guanylate kinase|nr:guanylate kinase [Sneathiellales bacterium]
MTDSRRGLMLVLSSPSGAGKSTIASRLLALEEELVMSVSCTTRPRRPGEADGTDYRFVDLEKFNLMVEGGELLEHAKVFGNYYGTPRSEVYELIESGNDVLFDIDWQGTQNLKAVARAEVVSVFILPPSTGELERRLEKRAQDPADVIAVRMAKASEEISHWAEYDYVVVNDDLGTALSSVRSILHAERLRRGRQPGLPDFVKMLREGV